MARVVKAYASHSHLHKKSAGRVVVAKKPLYHVRLALLRPHRPSAPHGRPLLSPVRKQWKPAYSTHRAFCRGIFCPTALRFLHLFSTRLSGHFAHFSHPQAAAPRFSSAPLPPSRGVFLPLGVASGHQKKGKWKCGFSGKTPHGRLRLLRHWFGQCMP